MTYMCGVGAHIILLVHQISFLNVDLILITSLFEYDPYQLLIMTYLHKINLYIIHLPRSFILLTIDPKIKMESLHILLAIIFICLTIAFCVGLWIWQFFRSTNHAISLMINYYSAFNTRLKNIEQSINNLNSIINSVPVSQ